MDTVAFKKEKLECFDLVPRLSLTASPYFCMARVALRNMDLLIKTDWSVTLLRTLALGRRQQSESIEVALDME